MKKTNTHITFVATAHKEDKWHRHFISSMKAQTDQNFWAEVIHNGPMDETWNTTGNIDMTDTPVNTGMWGCANRQQAIDECDTDYIIQTSVQDYWLPQAVQYINEAIVKHQPHILIWNSVNHLVGPCQVLDAQLAWSKVDWGNVAIRTDIARKVRIQQKEYCADWLFIKDILDKNLVDRNKILKINALLTIHN